LNNGVDVGPIGGMASRQDHCGQQRGRQAIYFGHVKALGLQGIGRW
jgi:hypothetical protein